MLYDDIPVLIIKMSEQEQFVFYVYFYEGKTYGEIAKTIGVTREAAH